MGLSPATSVGDRCCKSEVLVCKPLNSAAGDGLEEGNRALNIDWGKGAGSGAAPSSASKAVNKLLEGLEMSNAVTVQRPVTPLVLLAASVSLVSCRESTPHTLPATR
jgi:hypothetical protein